jgi:Fur family ferric uptake transcriptional regulator
MTGQRRAVCLAVVSRLPVHFDASGLLGTANLRAIKCGKATVYRTLELLVESGLVRKMELGNGAAVYELAAARLHHEHLVCEECGKVIEFESREIERLQEKICKERGFTPKSHMLKISGVCKECRIAARRKN